MDYSDPKILDKVEKEDSRLLTIYIFFKLRKLIILGLVLVDKA